MKSSYDVVVGNLGTIYSGPSYVNARREFNAYQALSEMGYGRVSHEPVYLSLNPSVTGTRTGSIWFPRHGWDRSVKSMRYRRKSRLH